MILAAAIVSILLLLALYSAVFLLENGTKKSKNDQLEHQRSIAITSLPPKEIINGGKGYYAPPPRKTPNYALLDSSGSPSISPDFQKDTSEEMVKIQEAMTNIAASSLIEKTSPIQQRDKRLKHFFGTYFGAGTISWMVAIHSYTNQSTKQEMEQIRSDLISWRTDYNFHQCPGLYSLGCLYKPAGDEQYWVSELVSYLFDAIQEKEGKPLSQIDLFSMD